MFFIRWDWGWWLGSLPPKLFALEEFQSLLMLLCKQKHVSLKYKKERSKLLYASAWIKLEQKTLHSCGYWGASSDEDESNLSPTASSAKIDVGVPGPSWKAKASDILWKIWTRLLILVAKVCLNPQGIVKLLHLYGRLSKKHRAFDVDFFKKVRKMQFFMKPLKKLNCSHRFM